MNFLLKFAVSHQTYQCVTFSNIWKCGLYLSRLYIYLENWWHIKQNRKKQKSVSHTNRWIMNCYWKKSPYDPLCLSLKSDTICNTLQFLLSFLLKTQILNRNCAGFLKYFRLHVNFINNTRATWTHMVVVKWATFFASRLFQVIFGSFTVDDSLYGQYFQKRKFSSECE